jgi:hypothetical protein
MCGGVFVVGLALLFGQVVEDEVEVVGGVDDVVAAAQDAVVDDVPAGEGQACGWFRWWWEEVVGAVDDLPQLGGVLLDVAFAGEDGT